MCQHCGGLGRVSQAAVLAKRDFTPEEEQVYQALLEDYVETLAPVEGDIEAFVAEASDAELESLDAIRAEIQERTDGRETAFKTVFQTRSEEGAAVGRELAAGRFDLGIDFDTVPQSAIDTLDEWSETAAKSTLETITEDTSYYLRGAFEDGLDVDEIADVLNEELFEGRLEGYVAERASRTATISSLETGNHSAVQDSSAIGEEWVTTLDGREREDHAAADGQIVAVETPFLVGGAELQHPGDPAAPIAQIANCRCTAVPRFRDQLTDAENATLENGGRLNA